MTFTKHAEWEARFWAKVDKNGPTQPHMSTPCWVWTGSRLPKGYGRFYPQWKKAFYAHVVSWEIANGREVPVGLHVCHHCDFQSCVRPDHLFAGTRSDNMRDSVRKGRHGGGGARGEASPAAKLTVAAVLEIRRRHQAGATFVQLAREFGVSKVAVRFAFTGKTWKTVREPPTGEAA